jgi:hypothetical protein
MRNTINLWLYCIEIEVLTPVVMRSTIFWDIPPYNQLKIDRHFGGRYRLKFQVRISRAWNQWESMWQAELSPDFTLVSCSAYFSTLEMENLCSFETSVDFELTTRRYIPEDSTHHMIILFVQVQRSSPLSLFWKNDSRLMRSSCYLCVCESSLLTSEWLKESI